MMRSRGRAGRHLLAAVASGLAVYAVSVLHGPLERAAASCAAPIEITDAIRQSDIVIVGTVTTTRSRDRIATVDIDEVWKGDVGDMIEIHGGPAQENTATSVDRTYEDGRRYLIFVFEPRLHGSSGPFGARYEDNNCSDTQLWSESLARYRPQTAISTTTVGSPSSRAPSASQPESGDAPPWPAIVLVSAGAATGIGLLATRARRRRTRHERRGE